MKRSSKRVCIVAVGILTAALAAHGQTWTGGSNVDDNWSAPENWQGNTAPVNDGSAALVFQLSDRYAPFIDEAWHVNGLTFGADTPNYAFSGETLTLGAGGMANAGASSVRPNVTFAGGISLSAGQLWNFSNNNSSAPGSSLVVSGALDIGSHELTMFGRAQSGTVSAYTSAYLTLNGGLMGEGLLTLGRNTTVRIYGDNSAFTGEVSRGVHSYLEFDSDYGLGGTGSVLTFASGNNQQLRYAGDNEDGVRLANLLRVSPGGGLAQVFLTTNEGSIPFIFESGAELIGHLQLRAGSSDAIARIESDVFGPGGVTANVNSIFTLAEGAQGRYLGHTLFDRSRTALEIDGILTAGDWVLNDNEPEAQFVQAAPVTIAIRDAGFDSVLRGSGEIHRDVLIVGAGQTYFDFFTNQTPTSAGSAVLDGSLSFGGTLTVNSTAGSGSVTILDGGTLKGTGTIGGDVAIRDGGTLSPGENVGTLTLAGTGLTLHSGSTSLFEIESASSYDRVLSIGAIQYGGILAIHVFDGFTPQADDAFELFGFTDSALDPDVSAFDAFDFSAAPLASGLAWSFDYGTGILSVIEDMGFVLGDFNGDGVLSGLDIPGFKTALADPDGWASANPERPHPNALGDFNTDGVFSGLDIPGFKTALAGGAAAIPEPASALALFAAAAFALKRRRA